MAERYSSFNRGGTLWFLQRATAAILVVTLMFHFFWLHFVNHAAEISFQGTSYRMSQIGYLLTLLVFLVTAAFHGVNGVYNALVNQGLTGTPKTALKWVLAAGGVVLVIQGFRVAAAMAGGGI
ncbi:MAG: succinate dehydrogenase [Halanaeroarchaeum sp.]